MQIGKRYVITEPSDDGSFQKGDHVRVENDGDLLCFEAHGWIGADERGDALKGAKWELDKEHLMKRKAKLEADLKQLEEKLESL